MKRIVYPLLFLLLVSLVSAEMLTLDLIKGKNTLTTPHNFQPVPVKNLVFSNQAIESIFTEENNQTIAFLNIFGGVGKDFFIMPKANYEIYVSQNLTIYFGA